MNILLIIIIIFLATFVWGGLSAAPWVPCKSDDLKRIFDFANLDTNKTFVDIGAGNGKTVIAAAQAGAIAHGYEISLFPYIIARLKILLLPREIRRRIFFHYKSFWNVDLGQFDCIYLFLMPKIFPRLVKKIKNECTAGTKIICYVWPLPELSLKKISEEENHPKIFFYEK